MTHDAKTLADDLENYKSEYSGKWACGTPSISWVEIDLIIQSLRLAASTQAPVAWRWKPKGAQLWIYNPEAGWLAEQERDTIDVEPLYAAPPSLPADAVREAYEACAKIAETKYSAPEWYILYRMAGDSIATKIRAALSPDAGDRG